MGPNHDIERSSAPTEALGTEAEIDPTVDVVILSTARRQPSDPSRHHDLKAGHDALDTAVRLEAVIGSTAETRLALQAAHDLWEARKGVNVKGLKKTNWADQRPTFQTPRGGALQASVR